jgi:hypothetical protein
MGLNTAWPLMATKLALVKPASSKVCKRIYETQTAMVSPGVSRCLTSVCSPTLLLRHRQRPIDVGHDGV